MRCISGKIPSCARVELNETAKGRVRGLVELRQTVNELIDYQMEDYPEEDIRANSGTEYALWQFTAEYGLINSRSNAQAFADDSSYYLLCSLENINENGERGKQGGYVY